MNKVLIIARLSMLENSRKQIFHVLCLLMLAVIAGSTLLSMFTAGVKIKILKDLCMSVISFGGAVLSIALASSAIPSDVETRTIHPLFARPVTRWQYVLGKFFGTALTVSIGIVIMSVAFATLIFSYEAKLDPFMLTAIGFIILESAVIAAITTAISMKASPALTAMAAFLVYLFGTIKIGYFGEIIEHAKPSLFTSVFSFIYHLLPNLESFNLKNAFVHSDPVPAAYLAQVGIYGVLFIAFALLIGYVSFARKEV